MVLANWAAAPDRLRHDLQVGDDRDIHEVRPGFLHLPHRRRTWVHRRLPPTEDACPRSTTGARQMAATTLPCSKNIRTRA